MTECERLRSDLKAFLDGQLSPAARIAMRLHLNRCEACRQEIEEMRLMGTRMRAADSLEMSGTLRARILAAVPTTAPDAKVPMLPKWREKPVLIWGASASAVLAWFVLYPATNRSQDHASHSNSAAANPRQIGTGLLLYTQDYDTPIVTTTDGGAQANEQLYASGKKNADSSWMLHQPAHLNLRIQAGNGRKNKIVFSPPQELLNNGTPSNGNLNTLRGTLKPYGKAETNPAPNIPSRPSHHISFADANGLEDLITERQVHREATLTIEVANAEQQSESVERLVKESKGYVAQNQLTTVEDNTRQASLTCKVPVDQFDTVMGQLARLGLLKGKTLSGEDITEKVSDEQETGHVLRADILTTEEKLKERRRHSETVRDEETLRQLRIRVAQSQARLKMLTRLGTLSEITVELDEKPKKAVSEAVKPASPFMEEVSGTGQAAAHSFLMALRLPVQLLVWIVVYSPLWALLIFGYRRMTR